MTGQTTFEGAKADDMGLDLGFFPTQTHPIEMDSPFRREVRRLADRVGRQIADRRVWQRDIRPVCHPFA